MRIPFSIPDEPAVDLYEQAVSDDILQAERMKLALLGYFTSMSCPQTSMLPRSVLRSVIETSVINSMEMAQEFPEFGMPANSAKLLRCCYRSIWRALLLEWKARLILASGRTPDTVEFPSGFDSWIDLPEA